MRITSIISFTRNGVACLTRLGYGGYDSLIGPISNAFYCRGACTSGPNSYVVIMNKGIDTTIWSLVVFDSINLRPYRSPSVAFAPLEGRTIISGVYDSLNTGYGTLNLDELVGCFP